jgi:hypothetical protein
MVIIVRWLGFLWDHHQSVSPLPAATLALEDSFGELPGCETVIPFTPWCALRILGVVRGPSARSSLTESLVAC